MGPKTLTYNADVRHIVGEEFIAPRLMVGGGLHMVRWVATNAEYDPQTGKTRVEMDVAA